MVDLGIATITAAGDSAPDLGGGNSCHFSPTHPDAIRVGALQNGGPYSITINGKRSVYIEGSGFNDKAPDSNFGECIDIWAPGHEITGASNTGEYDGAPSHEERSELMHDQETGQTQEVNISKSNNILLKGKSLLSWVG